VSEIVRRYDSNLRYFVRSRSRPEVEHLVELDKWDGNGACMCENFRFDRLRRLKAGATPCEHTRCWHIERAREWLVDKLIRQLAAKEKESAK
jgi:hypothetical protein